LLDTPQALMSYVDLPSAYAFDFDYLRYAAIDAA